MFNMPLRFWRRASLEARIVQDRNILDSVLLSVWFMQSYTGLVVILNIRNYRQKKLSLIPKDQLYTRQKF